MAIEDIKVNIALRNTEGGDAEIVIENHLLGLSPYLLIVPEVVDVEGGEEAIIGLSGAFLDLEDTVEILEILLESIKQHLAS